MSTSQARYEPPNPSTTSHPANMNNHLGLQSWPRIEGGPVSTQASSQHALVTFVGGSKDGQVSKRVRSTDAPTRQQLVDHADALGAPPNRHATASGSDALRPEQLGSERRARMVDSRRADTGRERAQDVGGGVRRGTVVRRHRLPATTRRNCRLRPPCWPRWPRGDTAEIAALGRPRIPADCADGAHRPDR